MALVSAWRIFFWLCLAALVWPFVHMRRARSAKTRPRVAAGGVRPRDILFGEPAVFRSLVAFNALFLVQTALDIAYLWGGLMLPDGLTYADYAHRGAYPLVATALLAAAFVLIAMRPGGPADSSLWIRPLVLLWTAQNFLLVLSSLRRTGLYVAAYSLTELRLAAMIWMGLVALGLILIIVQIVRRKPTRWLLDANTLTAVSVLYLCCFVNFPYVITTYNVAHCREVRGEGPTLDVAYIFSLGPQALPAYEDFLTTHGMNASDAELLADARRSLAGMNWRDGSFRRWRLKRYFATQGAARAFLRGNP